MKKERTLFDNQISQALAGHTTTPSPALRDALMARLAAAPPRKAAWHQRRASRWLAAALFLIPASVLLYLLTTSNPNQPKPATAEPTALSSAPQLPAENTTTPLPTPALTEAGTTNTLPVNTPHSNQVTRSSTVPVATNSVTTPQEITSATGTDFTKSELPVVAEKTVINGKTEQQLPSVPSAVGVQLFRFELTPKKLTSPVFRKETLPLPAFVTVSKAARPRPPQDDLPSPAHYSPYHGPVSVGLSYTPEVMFNVLDDDNKFVHNASLDILFHYHDFSIRTGAGLGFAKGSSAIAVEYNPYKGSYQHLDSLDFVYDMHSEQLVAVYHTSERSVYDSVSKDAITKINKEYTYLQIPLIFGYQFFERERFEMSVNAGPTLSILLDTKESSDFDPGKNLIINTTTLSPDRIKTNWQFSAGLGFGYHLTPRLSVEVEPRMKYYFNSVYEKAATIRKPWSLELRSGVLYTF